MLSFYKNKNVLVTGHTGFKGSWLCKILLMLEANVVGISLKPNEEEISLYNILNIEREMVSEYIDIRDLEKLKIVFKKYKPEIVFHMAAQPLVIESYIDPVYTYETNIIGTVNIFESIRACKSVKSFINVTTDKVYHNKEWRWPYREIDELNGKDPYSNSKSCSELITNSYKESFFYNEDIAITTVRSGNVIGGGDFGENRIIPDCIRYAINNKYIEVRNPHSIRPYQHVFESLNAYLIIAKDQYVSKGLSGSYNIGPDEDSCIETYKLVDLFCNSWGNIDWIEKNENYSYKESTLLKLDCSKIKSTFNWSPKLNIKEAIDWTVYWSKNYYFGQNIKLISEQQIRDFFEI